jgi:hypothetical protein
VRITGALVLTLIVAGCGGGGSPATSSVNSATSTGGSGPKTERQSTDSPWRTLVTLNHLGTFRTRCTESPGNPEVFATVFIAEARSATDRVSLSLDGSTPQTRTLQPGERWATPLRATRFQTWRISQATEPQTVSAVVRIEPTRCAYGVPITDVHYGTSQFNSAAPL